MKKIAVLGSTGSIGKTALKIIERNSDEYKVVLLANDSSDEIFSQAKKFDAMNVFSRKGILIKDGKESSFYKDFLARPETYENVDIVINGIVGLAGLEPTLAVIEAGKILATANKESIVCAGNLINKKIINSKTIIRPVDSEHSTVWQCLEDKNDVKRIILTASGGAFRDFSEDRLAKAKAVDALKHPNWVMGKKVTIDCATLVNKGMEIIEAKRLFGINEVDAIMHRESIVHSLVEYKDGTMKACLSNPDMEIPIQLSISYPHRNNTSVDFLNLVKLGKLSFEVIDEKRFPCFSVCKNISDKGDYAGTIMNGANEIAVDAYLKDRISFYGIYDCIVNALQKFGDTGIIRDESDIYRIDKEVKEYTLRRIGE